MLCMDLFCTHGGCGWLCSCGEVGVGRTGVVSSVVTDTRGVAGPGVTDTGGGAGAV